MCSYIPTLLPLRGNSTIHALPGSAMVTGIATENIADMIDENPALRSYLMGYFSEFHFTRTLSSLKAVTSFRKIPDHDDQHGDYEVIYRGVPLTIEVKSISGKKLSADLGNGSWEGNVCIKRFKNTTNTSTHIPVGTFDILAINCFSVSGNWDFLYLENHQIPTAKSKPDFLTTSLKVNPVTTEGIQSDLLIVLESAYRRKTSAQLQLF